MNAGILDEQREKNEVKETDPRKRQQRTIILLFLLAVLSIGAFFLLRIFIQSMP